jgi:hypothetical protein
MGGTLDAMSKMKALFKEDIDTDQQ